MARLPSHGAYGIEHMRAYARAHHCMSAINTPRGNDVSWAVSDLGAVSEIVCTSCLR